ncbi:MAG: trigger factor [Clostridia bacterium]
MEIKVENTENKNEVKISFKVEAEKFENAIKSVYSKNAKYFAIPGFRKGKAPFNIVEKRYGDEIFYEDAFNELVPEIYENAIKEKNVAAVSQPKIDIQKMKKGEDLEFTATVQTKPEVKLGKYKGIELKKVEYTVSDEDVNHEIGHMQEKNARVTTVEDRPVQSKDITTIDFEGFVDGKAFEGGKAEGHELEIGSNTFIPGFEDQIIGMNKDEERDINVKFPEDYYSKELAGKDATFKVKLHEIKEKKLPDLDDEFAKDVSEFNTLKELKDSIKDKKQKENDSKAKREIEDAAIEKVCENTPVDIPSGMIDSEVANMVSEMEQQLSYQGISLDQYLKIMNKTRAEIEDNYKVQAEKNVKARLVIEAIIKEENIAASEEEIAEKLKEMANNYGRKIEDLEKNEHLKEYISESIKAEKAIDLIVENAKIK